MTPTVTPTNQITRLQRDTDAEEVARAVYEDVMGLLLTLEPDEWNRLTDCAPWTVTDMVRHLVGAAKGHASLRETLRQSVHGARHASEHGGSRLDAMNDLQVSEHAHLSGPELISELDRVWSEAVRGRMGRPAVIRMVRVANDTSGSTPSGTGARVKLAQLFDVILTRDVWLHRIDIARAVDRPVTFGPHDRRVIEDVIAEWAERLDNGFDLTIVEPFIARYRAGDGGAHLTLDAIELCRVLSGRASHPSPLFDTKVLF